jgi:hypothetical protein
MKVGFTGSRNGMSKEQMAKFKDVLFKYILAGTMIEELHHGCCVGADATLVLICITSMPNTVLVAHPPFEKKLVDRGAVGLSNVLWPEAPYLVRNQNIVHATDILLAAPNGPERLRSGTWSTIRYARKHGGEVIIL